MDPVSVFDAKNRLSALLDQVERGHEIVITRRGKAVARLVPTSIPDRPHMAVARLDGDAGTRARATLHGVRCQLSRARGSAWPAARFSRHGTTFCRLGVWRVAVDLTLATSKSDEAHHSPMIAPCNVVTDTLVVGFDIVGEDGNRVLLSSSLP